MAEALARETLVLPRGHRPMAFSSSKKSPLCVRFPRCSSIAVVDERGCAQIGGFERGRLVLEAPETLPIRRNLDSPHAKLGHCIGKGMKWWEKSLHPNMKEIESTQDLVDTLLNAGDNLVIIDFYSPGCGGCRALHPKICQIAEMNPDALFLQVNYENHKSMCYSLNVHVLPFFRFYRGVQGRLCSFSCTNATIKKFKDALAKHAPERCSLGPAKGLEESELMALAANKDIAFDYTTSAMLLPDAAPTSPKLPLFSPLVAN